MRLVEAIGKRVDFLLKERNLSLYKLEQIGGVPRSTVSDIILVKKKKVTTDTIYQICATIEISLKEFFDDPIFNEVND